MARPEKDQPNVSAAAESQAQMGSGEQDYKARNAPEKKAAKDDEIQFFDGTIAKVVERENDKGEKEWVDVMSDNLYPGEKLKRALDEEKAEEKAKASRKAADDAAKDRK